MSAAGEPRHLGLEVRFDAAPIEGRIFDHDDHARLDRPFSGWLGLIAAIEAAGAQDTERERDGNETH
jgi:hypothetical protein